MMKHILGRISLLSTCKKVVVASLLVGFCSQALAAPFHYAQLNYAHNLDVNMFMAYIKAGLTI